MRACAFLLLCVCVCVCVCYLLYVWFVCVWFKFNVAFKNLFRSHITSLSGCDRELRACMCLHAVWYKILDMLERCNILNKTAITHLPCTGICFINEPRHEKIRFAICEQHRRRQAYAFKLSRLKLAYVAEQIGLSLSWSQSTEDRFSCDVVHLCYVMVAAASVGRVIAFLWLSIVI